MALDRSFWLATGIAIGVLGARALQPGKSRELAKSLLKGSFRVHEWLLIHLDLVREDIEDLFAETRAEYESEQANPKQDHDGHINDNPEGDDEVCSHHENTHDATVACPVDGVN